MEVAVIRGCGSQGEPHENHWSNQGLFPVALAAADRDEKIAGAAIRAATTSIRLRAKQQRTVTLAHKTRVFDIDRIGVLRWASVAELPARRGPAHDRTAAAEREAPMSTGRWSPSPAAERSSTSAPGRARSASALNQRGRYNVEDFDFADRGGDARERRAGHGKLPQQNP